MRAPILAITIAAILPCLQAQEAPKPAISAKIFKGEVDGLIRLLRNQAKEGGALGNGGCRHTAMVLSAAGNCHRFYHAGDGPWIRNAVRSLFLDRRKDGSFGDLETTRWVISALKVMDPDSYAEDIAALTAQIRRHHLTYSCPLIAGAPRNEDLPEVIEKLQSNVTALQKRTPDTVDPEHDIALLVSLVRAQVAARKVSKPKASARSPLAWSATQQKSFDYLLRQQRSGIFIIRVGDKEIPDAGLTALSLAALQSKPAALRTKSEEKVIEAGIEWILEQQSAEGAFGQRNLNYTTCAAVMALAKANDPRFKPVLDKAQQYILFIQNTETRGYQQQDRDYGSIGYGGDERGDLSNLQFALGALGDTKLSAEHEAFAKTLIFLQRTQNLIEVNDFKRKIRDPDSGEWRTVAPGDDGGAAYYPGNSPAGYIEQTDGSRIPRSYGSMTYALLKAYTLCGLPPDDRRVLATIKWLGQNWALDTNPGSDPGKPEKTKYQGLFYYYMVMAQALNTAGVEELETWQGEGTQKRKVVVNWRTDLGAQIKGMQAEDGSWLNERNGRWFESQALICTAYAMLALEHCDDL